MSKSIFVFESILTLKIEVFVLNPQGWVLCVCPVPCYEFEFQWINLELTDSEEDKYLMTLDWLVTSNQ